MISFLGIFKKDARGFTLIEVMISLFILTFGFLGIIGLMTVIIDKNRVAGQITEATTLAQSKIEYLNNMTFSSISTGTHPLESLSATGEAGSLYTRTTTVAETNTGMKSVSVAVSWKRKGVKTITLQSIISN